MKRVLTAMAFFIALHSSVYAESPEVGKTDDVTVKLTEVIQQKDNPFFHAYSAYLTAKTASDAHEKSESYALAIREINAALIQDETDMEALFLASQIYRGKGGVVYAKNYFKRAESVVLENLQKYPQSITTHLDCAILYYTGDVRFWEDYTDYKNKAVLHAKIILKLCEKVEGDKKELPRLCGIKAMAYLVLDDKEKCLEYLQKYAAFSQASEVYVDVFKKTVMQNTWYWQVSAESVSKEFLLYLFTDGVAEADVDEFLDEPEGMEKFPQALQR